MIIRRITHAVRTQDWFTVTLEILIVVVGVFFGLQANNWNEARMDRERSQEYLSRIRADLVADMAELQGHRAFWAQVAERGYAAIRYAETGDLDGAARRARALSSAAGLSREGARPHALRPHALLLAGLL